MDSDVVFVSAVRTPIGSFNGILSEFSAADLGGFALKGALTQANVKAEDIDLVIMGHVLQAGAGQNPARQASVNAGLGYYVPAYSVNMVCGSGLLSIIQASQSLRLGEAKLVLAGGQESMSRSPHCIFMREGTKMGNTQLKDTMVLDGLTDAFNDVVMGLTAENIGSKFGITREEQDEFSLSSQHKYLNARSNGYYADEIVPVRVTSIKGDASIFVDEHPRTNASISSLVRLTPFCLKDGSVTAGNSSGVCDGAAAVLVMLRSEASKRGLPPLGRIVASAQVCVDPMLMGIAPVDATRKACEKAGWTLDSVDLFELNEAFAVQSIAVVRELGVSPDKVNVAGGSIALGHPLGCSGTRIVVTLLHAMKRLKARRGVAAICVGGGMGLAICVESLEESE